MDSDKSSFRLLLEVREFGSVRRYEQEQNMGNDDQQELAESIAYSIAIAIRAVCNISPTPEQLASAASRDVGLMCALKHISDAWDCENRYQDCVEIVVDWDKLNEMPGRRDIEARTNAEFCGAKSKPGCKPWVAQEDDQE